jgi:hypothetical protein
MVNKYPFLEDHIHSDYISETYVRTFKKELDSEDLLWHWDEEDRVISPLEETDWQFQFDNKLPQRVEGEIKIPKGVWHRLIKGSGDLIIEVKKMK